MRNRLVATILLLICMVVPAYSDQNTITLQINVSGAAPSKGHIILSLFSTVDNYLKKPIVSMTKPVSVEGSTNFEIKDLSPGKYALSAIFDEDSNGELTTGMFVIPKELVGFSNNAKGKFGPPKFDKVVFEALTSQKITIQLGKTRI